CAGTHPFSRWHEQQVTEHDRYRALEEEMQDVIRSLVIFGLHVHVGIPDQEHRIEVMNEARYFLPHLLALSTSSPFWMGRNTGLKSYRSAICAKLLKLRRANLGFRKYPPALTGENKWRAMRYGIDGRLIDFGKQAEVPMRDLALELLDFVDDVVDELHSREAVEYVHTILA